MRVAIVGSRNFHNLESVRQFVKSLPSDTVVVSGGASGVDRTAEIAARDAGLEVKIFYPDWENLGRRAGFVRNQMIVDDADRIVAFWDGVSRGTADTIERAKRAGKIVAVQLDEGL